jgi:hypothetical protein
MNSLLSILLLLLLLVSLENVLVIAWMGRRRRSSESDTFEGLPQSQAEFI